MTAANTKHVAPLIAVLWLALAGTAVAGISTTAPVISAAHASS
jgi:hypothetical protein